MVELCDLESFPMNSTHGQGEEELNDRKDPSMETFSLSSQLVQHPPERNAPGVDSGPAEDTTSEVETTAHN